jgi:tripartite-type tricarboxylate transporter receptor subunit TctC
MARDERSVSTFASVITRALAVMLCAFLPPLASAATPEYPEKPIRWVVPWPPGGGVDIATRLMSPALSEALGQNFIVENRAGASGMLGTSFAAKAPADGYTIITGAAGPNGILPHVNPKVPYDSLKDFASIVYMVNTVYVLVVHPSLRVKNVPELIALAKARPGELTIGSAGSGTPAHLAGEFFTSLSGVKLVHVPYKGAAGPALDVMSGHIVMTIETISPLLPHIRAGKLKALGVTSRKRSSQLSAVPTIAEAGLPDYEVVNWYGLLAPAGTPTAVIDKLNKGVNHVLARPNVRERLVATGLEIVGSTPEEFRKFRQADFEKWGRIVKDANIRFEP